MFTRRHGGAEKGDCNCLSHTEARRHGGTEKTLLILLVSCAFEARSELLSREFSVSLCLRG